MRVALYQKKDIKTNLVEDIKTKGFPGHNKLFSWRLTGELNAKINTLRMIPKRVIHKHVNGSSMING